MGDPSLVFTRNINETIQAYCLENNIIEAVILCDTNTRKFCLPLIESSRFHIIEVNNGEQSKSFETVQLIVQRLIEIKANRQTVLFNLGGGVITDLGGFVASIFMRGINFVNIPTSLLSMVDASIGGKTGIDFLNYKNCIGAFKHARTIIVAPEFLQTLPQMEIKSAWAEMIKIAAISNEKLFVKMECIGDQLEIISACAQTKFQIVEDDFLDHGKRQLLNFGHTFGHAIESFYYENSKEISHGYAVAQGMLIEVKVAKMICGLSQLDANRIEKLIYQYLAPFEKIDIDISLLEKYLLGDKKNNDALITFSLPNGIGSGVFNLKVSIQQLKNWKIEGIL